MFRSSIEKKLVALSQDMRALRHQLGIVEEQLLQVSDEAENLRLRAMVSETPLAASEHRDAAKSVAALKRDRDATVEKLDRLERRQDELLDRLAGGGQSSPGAR